MIYLDNAATSFPKAPGVSEAMARFLDADAASFPKPEAVYQAMDRFARSSLGNPGRSGHKLALASEQVLQDCRHALNQFLGGDDAERFVFTLNCTDALNIAIKGALQPGDHVITTDLEHNSVSRPLVALEKAGVITLTRVKSDAGGTVSPDDIQKALTLKTRLIAVAHASNVLGTVQPIAEIGALARRHELLLLVDAAQTAGVVPIDIRAQQIDLLAFPGHKSLLGPTGTGALYVGPRARLRPWREGGTGGDSQSPTQPTELPHYLEGGTPNVHGLVGLREGLRFINERGRDAIHVHEMKLVELLWQRLDELPGIHVLGHRDRQRHVAAVSFYHETIAAPDIGAALDASFNIAVRPGLHCAPYIHRAQQTIERDGAVRVSPGLFNTSEDIESLVAALGELGAGV
jgi:cysteine desulfurase/selenocysteine lyase